jgi:hypothetical protein
MSATKASKFDCKCIDHETLTTIKISLITSKDTYEDIIKSLIKMGKPSTNVDVLHTQATKFHEALEELNKIPPC